MTTDTILATIASRNQPEALGVRFREGLAIVRVTSSGAVLDTVATGRGFEAYTVPFTEGGFTGVSSQSVGMGGNTEFATGPGRIIIGDSERAEFRIIDLPAARTRVIRWTEPADQVTAADRAAHFAFESTDLASARGGDPQMRATMMANLRNTVFATQGPHYTGFLPSDDGGVWLERFPRPWRLARRYLAVDSTGAIIARVDLPPKVRPWQIAGDRIVARWRDADDVDHVRVYRLQRP